MSNGKHYSIKDMKKEYLRGKREVYEELDSLIWFAYEQTMKDKAKYQLIFYAVENRIEQRLREIKEQVKK